MPVKSFRPVTPSRRFMSVTTRDELAKKSRAGDAPSRKPPTPGVSPKGSRREPDDEALLLHRLYAGVTGFTLAKNAYDAARGADALAIVTEWQEFRSPDFERLRELLKSPVIFDGRNLYDPPMVSRFGLTYYAIGRGKLLAAA